MTLGPGNPLLEDSVAFLFTDGSTLPSGPAGWEVRIIYTDRAYTKALRGPVVTTARSPNWVGAFAATNNTGSKTERNVPPSSTPAGLHEETAFSPWV